LGRNFAGLVLLAAATSLPELATATTATLTGNVDLAVHNLLGGVVLLTAVLAGVDALVGRGALTYFAPRYVLLLQGVGVVLLLAIALMGVALGGPAQLVLQTPALTVAVGPAALALVPVYLAMIYLTYRGQGAPRWQPDHEVSPPDDVGDRPSAEGQPRHGDAPTQADGRGGDGRARRAPWGRFAGSALVVLVAGYVVAQAGEALAAQTGLSTSFVGFTLVALATSLPEVSTTAAAARHRRYSLAVSNVFGSNAFDVTLLALVGLLAGGAPLLGRATASGQFAAALGIVVTCVYLWGLLERADRTIARLGWDSWLVLLLAAGGMAVIYSLP
jgi:cation:H+ antiporter